MRFGCEVLGPGDFLEATMGKSTICDNKFEEVHNIFVRRQVHMKKKKTKWIRPAPRASGLRPQLDSVVFPPHMRSVKK